MAPSRIALAPTRCSRPFWRPARGWIVQVLHRRATSLTRSLPRALPKQSIHGSLTRDGDLWWFQLGTGPLLAISKSIGARVLAMILVHRDGVSAEAICAALDNRGPQPEGYGLADQRYEDPSPPSRPFVAHRSPEEPDRPGKARPRDRRGNWIPEKVVGLREIVRQLKNQDREELRQRGKRPETPHPTPSRSGVREDRDARSRCRAASEDTRADRENLQLCGGSRASRRMDGHAGGVAIVPDVQRRHRVGAGACDVS